MGYIPKLVRRGDGNFYNVYRPLRFDEMIGASQELIKAFSNVLESKGQLSNQTYLFVGDSGSGKTTLAYILGLSMNCLDPQPNKITGAKIEPCLECDHCKMALSGGGMRNTSTSPLSLWNSSTLNKDAISEIVYQNILAPRPLGAKISVNIFDEAHKLTKEQKSVLLQPLEALPRHSYVFFTTNVENILMDKKDKQTAAVISRFTRVKLPSWTTDDLISMLTDVSYIEASQNKMPKLTRGALRQIAVMSEGNARTAMGMIQHVLESHMNSSAPVTEAQVTDLFPTADSIEPLIKQGIDLKPLFTALSRNSVSATAAALKKLEDDRANPVDISYVLNKFFKNKVYRAAETNNKEAVSKALKQLHIFTSRAIGDAAGEPYARLMHGVLGVLGV